jgi:hypothetical protein
MNDKEILADGGILPSSSTVSTQVQRADRSPWMPYEYEQ